MGSGRWSGREGVLWRKAVEREKKDGVGQKEGECVGRRRRRRRRGVTLGDGW
jgi:hypothetical protein